MDILIICGSLRKDSWNRKLARIAAGVLAESGTNVTEADISDLPLYNEDLEIDPWPAAAKRFYDQVDAADAVVIVSPEYNYSIPGVLKNALDWASVGDNAWEDKHIALMGVSTGQYGTTKMQMHLRQALLGTGPVTVVPHPQVAIGPAATAFNEDGSLRDPKMMERVRQLLSNLLEAAGE